MFGLLLYAVLALVLWVPFAMVVASDLAEISPLNTGDLFTATFVGLIGAALWPVTLPVAAVTLILRRQYRRHGGDV